MIWFKKLKKFYFPPATGLIPDPRPLEEKERDYKVEEIFRAEPVRWQERKPEQWRRFPIFNQDRSSSCVAQTIAKLLGVENYLEENLFVLYSAGDIYSQRKNYPSEGMWFKDGMEIGYKLGAVLEQLMPSQRKTEAELNSYRNKRTPLMKEIALPGKGGNYLALPFDFDIIAQEIQKGKAVCLGFRFNSGDWISGEVMTRKGGTYGHAVAGVDFCLWKGKKGIIFDNSFGENWGFGGQGIVTEDKAEGIMGAWYYEDFSNFWRINETLEKPKYYFKKDLFFRMRNNDISMLQRCLGYLKDKEGYLFPLDIPSTGYFGSITLKAVKRYQVLRNISPVLGYVGSLTRESLNQEFS